MHRILDCSSSKSWWSRVVAICVVVWTVEVVFSNNYDLHIMIKTRFWNVWDVLSTISTKFGFLNDSAQISFLQHLNVLELFDSILNFTELGNRHIDLVRRTYATYNLDVLLLRRSSVHRSVASIFQSFHGYPSVYLYLHPDTFRHAARSLLWDV